MCNLNFFRCNCKIHLAEISTNENLHPCILLKLGPSRFTSPVKIVFTWNNVLSSQCQIIIKKMSEIEVTKKDVEIFFFGVSYDFEILFQNYPLSIINAHWSLANKLWDREWGLGESSVFSHPLGTGGGWGLVVVVTASHAQNLKGFDTFYCIN